MSAIDDTDASTPGERPPKVSTSLAKSSLRDALTADLQRLVSLTIAKRSFSLDEFLKIFRSGGYDMLHVASGSSMSSGGQRKALAEFVYSRMWEEVEGVILDDTAATSMSIDEDELLRVTAAVFGLLAFYKTQPDDPSSGIPIPINETQWKVLVRAYEKTKQLKALDLRMAIEWLVDKSAFVWCVAQDSDAAGLAKTSTYDQSVISTSEDVERRVEEIEACLTGDSLETRVFTGDQSEKIRMLGEQYDYWKQTLSNISRYPAGSLGVRAPQIVKADLADALEAIRREYESSVQRRLNVISKNMARSFPSGDASGKPSPKKKTGTMPKILSQLRREKKRRRADGIPDEVLMGNQNMPSIDGLQGSSTPSSSSSSTPTPATTQSG